MAKKMILNRARAIPTTEAPFVSRKDMAPSTSRNIHPSETAKQLPFRILNETFKSFPKFNTTGRSLLIKFNSLGEEQDPTTYLKECITTITNYLVDNVLGRGLVGLTFQRGVTGTAHIANTSPVVECRAVPACCTVLLIRLYRDNIGRKCNRTASCVFVKELALLWCG